MGGGAYPSRSVHRCDARLHHPVHSAAIRASHRGVGACRHVGGKMRRRLGSVTLAAAAALGFAAPAMAANDALNAYRVKPTAENKQELAKAGYDLAEGDRGRYLEIFATRGQAAALEREGIDTK